MSRVDFHFFEPSVIMEDERANVEAHIFCAMEDINAGGIALPDSRWEHIVRCVLRYVDAEQDLKFGAVEQSLYGYHEESKPEMKGASAGSEEEGNNVIDTELTPEEQYIYDTLLEGVEQRDTV